MPRDTFPSASDQLVGDDVSSSGYTSPTSVLCNITRTFQRDVAAGVNPQIRRVGATAGVSYARSGSTNTLLRSTDYGASWAVFGIAPAEWAQVEEVLELRSGTILVVARTTASSSTQRSIYRSNDSGASWVKIFDFQVNGADITKLLHPQGWIQRSSAISNDVFVAEYLEGGASIRLLRSTDDGQSFTAAYTWSTSGIGSIRHLHSVYEDPFVPTRLWITAGDSASESRVGYSDDNGSSWTYVTQGDGVANSELHNQSRVVGLAFTAEAVFWGADTPSVPANIYRYDRTAGTVTKVTTQGFAGSFYGGVTLPNGVIGFVTNSEPASSWALGVDDYVRLVASPDGGKTWETVFRWLRASTGGATAPFLVPPRAGENEFWVFWENLEDFPASDGVNFKFQLSKCNPADRADPDWRKRYTAWRNEHFGWTGFGSGSLSVAIAHVHAFYALKGDGRLIFRPVSGDTPVTQDGANYWQPTAVVTTPAGSQRAAGGTPNGTVFTARIPAAPVTVRFKQGDEISFRMLRTGTPSNINRVGIDCTVIYDNVTPPL